MRKTKQILIKCVSCGKSQYVREDSLCAEVRHCSGCASTMLLGKFVPQAPADKKLPVTHCACGRAVTTHDCIEYDCPNCMKG